MRRIFTALLFAWCCTMGAVTYDVRDFGAVGDGHHIDSPRTLTKYDASG